MVTRLFTKIFGTRFDRELKRIQPIVDAIHEHEVRLKDLSDAELQGQTAKFRELIAQRTGAQHAEVERLKQAKHDCPDPEERANLSEQLRKAEHEFVAELQRTLDDLLPEACATVREAARLLSGARPTCATSRTAPTTNSASTTCATTWSSVWSSGSSAATCMGSSTKWTRS